MTNIECALRLEKVFEKLAGSIYVEQAEFLHHPTEAIERGLSYLLAQNILTIEDMKLLCAEYNFEEYDLKDLLSDNSTAERIQELLARLEAWYKAEQ